MINMISKKDVEILKRRAPILRTLNKKPEKYMIFGELYHTTEGGFTDFSDFVRGIMELKEAGFVDERTAEIDYHDERGTEYKILEKGQEGLKKLSELK